MDYEEYAHESLDASLISPSPSPTFTLTPSSSPEIAPIPPSAGRPPVHPSSSNQSDPFESVEGSNSSVRKAKALTSDVWPHFVRFTADGQQWAKCKKCSKKLTGNTKNGTSHLRDHISHRCPMRHMKVDIKQQVLNMNRKADGTTKLENSNFSQEVSRAELVNMVVLHEYPLSIVDHIGFRRFVSSLNPTFRIISRNTLRSDILKQYGGEKLNLKRTLEDNMSRIAITTDMWTASNKKKGYMAVTAHYIDQSWNLCNRTLRFVYVPCPHTKDVLGQVLMDTLNMYNIAEKISSVVVDNCSTNDAMMDALKLRFDSRHVMLSGEFLHMRCSAHILNLIVQDGLEVIGSGIERIRDCVSFWQATAKRIEMFENKVKSLKIDCSRKLVLDCKTRWNSTFAMLRSAFPYRDVFTSLKIQNARMKFVVPNAEDWSLAELICEKLEIFHKVTELFSGRKYPTSNLFFVQVCEIKIALTSWLSSDVMIIQNMATKMIEKFDKYWDTINGLLAVAAILDPRYKLECVEFYFSEVYGDQAEFEIERVKVFLYQLMEEYHNMALSSDVESSKYTSSNDGVLGKRKDSSSSISDGDIATDRWSQAKKMKRRKVNVRSEMDHYLEEDALPSHTQFDVLKFWSIELKYPTLQKIARDVLAIPASTVASESAFSMGGRVVSPHRSRLHANTVEALMCLQNWILADYSSFTLHNARACATILEDDDAAGDTSSSGSTGASVITDMDSEEEHEMDN